MCGRLYGFLLILHFPTDVTAFSVAELVKTFVLRQHLHQSTKPLLKLFKVLHRHLPRLKAPTLFHPALSLTAVDNLEEFVPKRRHQISCYRNLDALWWLLKLQPQFKDASSSLVLLNPVSGVETLLTRTVARSDDVRAARGRGCHPAARRSLARSLESSHGVVEHCDRRRP